MQVYHQILDFIISKKTIVLFFLSSKSFRGLTLVKHIRTLSGQAVPARKCLATIKEKIENAFRKLLSLEFNGRPCQSWNVHNSITFSGVYPHQSFKRFYSETLKIQAITLNKWAVHVIRQRLHYSKYSHEFKANIKPYTVFSSSCSQWKIPGKDILQFFYWTALRAVNPLLHDCSGAFP